MDTQAKNQMANFVLEHSNDIYWRLDGNLTHTYLSPNAATLRGVSMEQELSEPLEAKYTKESYEQICAAVAEGIATLGNEGEATASLQAELICYDNEGTRYTKSVHIICHGVVKNGKIDYIEGLTRDVSEHLDYMKNLERMKCIGGVCHSLSQPIQSMAGIADILKMKCPDNEELKKWVDKLVESSERAAMIFQNLQTLRAGKSFKVKPYVNKEIIDVE
jgi:hypothetical protein